MARKKNQWRLWLLDAVAVRNRHPSVLAEGAVSDLDTNGRLTSLELAAIDHPDHARNRCAIEPRLDDFIDRAVFFYIRLKNGIEDGIRW